MSIRKKKDASLGKHAANQDTPKAEFTEISDSDQSPEKNDTVDELVNQAESKGAVSLSARSAGEESAALPAESYATFKPSFDILTNEKKHRGRKLLKVLRITFASILGLAALVYLAGCLFFIDRFWPHTTMGNYDISMKSLSEAKPILDQEVSGYQVQIKGQGLSFTISTQEAGLSFDAQQVLSRAVRDVKPWMWPLEIFETHDFTKSLTAGYNKAKVEEIVRAKLDEINATATQPTDATLVFDDKTQFFQIVPEELGTALDANAVLTVLDVALTSISTLAEISEEQLVQPQIEESNSMLRAARNSANTMLGVNITFTLAGSPVIVLDPATIAPWIKLGEDLNIVFDEAAFNGWIDTMIMGFNTVGAERTYTRPDGKVITVAGGSYGWEIDSEAFRNLVKDGVGTGQKGSVEIPVIQAGTGFDVIGGRDWGLRYCDIDLSEQYARFYDETGALIWESNIISGRPNGRHNTPTGVYMLNSKASPSKLIGEIDPATKKPEYETWVDYWMPFVGNAVGLHDATWQPSFGGAMYANGYGSHGCVNLPFSSAQALYGIIVEGDPVICHW